MAGQGAGGSPPHLEEGPDLVLLQVGLDPGLLVRRHQELRRRGLELLSPGGGGGCGPSGCSRLAPRAAQGLPEVPGPGLTPLPGSKGGQPGASRPLRRAGGGGGGLSPLREPRAGAAWSGAWCREGTSCKGGPRAVCAVRVRACEGCECVRVCVPAWQRLGYGHSRGWSCRPRHSAAPSASGRGLRAAPRRWAPVDGRAPARKEGREAGAALPCPALLYPALPSPARPCPALSPAQSSALRGLNAAPKLGLPQSGRWACRGAASAFPAFLNCVST